MGFERTELNDNEIRLLQQLLSAGNLFYPVPDGLSYHCVTWNPMQEPLLEPCADGKRLMDQFLSYQMDAKRNRTVGVLQFFLTGGRLIEIRVYRSDHGLAYEPYEKSGDWWLDGLTDSSPLLEELSSRAILPPISVLWPEKTADQANARAARILGNRYQLPEEPSRTGVRYRFFRKQNTDRRRLNGWRIAPPFS